jgi:hypothetical protein
MLFYDALVRGLTVSGSPLQSANPSGRSRVVFLRREHRLPEQLLEDFKALSLRDAATVVRKSRSAYWTHEAVELSLDYREGRLWLLFEPTLFLTSDGNGEPWQSEKKGETIRELMSQRYNRQLSGLETFWLKVIVSGGATAAIRFPASQDGFEFRLARTLGISYQQP